MSDERDLPPHHCLTLRALQCVANPSLAAGVRLA